MRIYDPLYLSTVSSSSATRRIPSAMGLYRIEGGCLYRIKIGRYPLERQRHGERERKVDSLCSQAAHDAGSSSSNCNSDRALGPLTLHEFRDAPLLLHPPSPSRNPILLPRSAASFRLRRSSFSNARPYSSPEFYFPSIPGSTARTTKPKG